MMAKASLPMTPSRKGVGRGEYNIPLTCRTPARPRSCNKRKYLSSPGDRFIPSRSRMNIELIRSSIRSAEKSRNSLTPQIFEKHIDVAMGRNTDEDQPRQTESPEASTPQRETADQESFRRTVGAIFHNRGVEEFEKAEPELRQALRSNDRKGSTILSAVKHHLKSDSQRMQDLDDFTHLAYASASEMAAEIKENSHVARTPAPKRLFQYNAEDSQVPSRPKINPLEHNHHKVIQRALSSRGEDSYMTEKRRSVQSKRRIHDKPTKVLDAPDIVDDYYLNLISWSRENILAVAMGPSVYVWNATTGEIGHVITLRGVGDYVSSVSWSSIPGCTGYLAIGTHSNTIQLWDTEKQRCVRKLRGHTNRISSLAWNINKKLLTSGGRDSKILLHDVRSPVNVVSTYHGHRQEVCGLKWNEDGHALASGGNENYLCIWDAAMSQRSRSQRQAGQDLEAVHPRLLLTEHKAAVKALDWNPFHRGLLASGGGSADRTIKFWNTVSGALTNSVDTGSQVCSLVWSKHHRELCSSHGFTENQLIVWKYPSMTKIKELKSHTARVLNMELSPDGRSIVSVGADETLRFWDVWDGQQSSRSHTKNDSAGMLFSSFQGSVVR